MLAGLSASVTIRAPVQHEQPPGFYLVHHLLYVRAGGYPHPRQGSFSAQDPAPACLTLSHRVTPPALLCRNDRLASGAPDRQPSISPMSPVGRPRAYISCNQCRHIPKWIHQYLSNLQMTGFIPTNDETFADFYFYQKNKMRIKWEGRRQSLGDRRGPAQKAR